MKIVLTNVITLKLTLNSRKVPAIVIDGTKKQADHTRMTHGHLMSRNDQQPIFRNVTCRNQRLTIKHCLQKYP